MTDYDVIVCGLGPVGQLLALLLGDRGVRTLALDREPEPYLLPRAAVIDDEVLRIFRIRRTRRGGARRRADPAGREHHHGRRAPGRDRPHPHGPARPPRRWSRSTSRRWSTRCSPRSKTGRASTFAGGSTLEALDRQAVRVDAFVRPSDGGRSSASPGAGWSAATAPPARCAPACRSRSRAAPTRSAGSSSTRSSTAHCARCLTRASSATRSARW